MVKLKSKKKLLWAFKQFKSKKSSQKDICNYLHISRQWFSRLYHLWIETNEFPIQLKKLGRPKRKIIESERLLILNEYNYAKNALYLESIIYAKYKMRIPHNHIHMVLKNEGLSRTEPNKSRRRKPWVRYERSHSLSAGHID